MDIQEEFDKLLEKLRTQRDEINLKMHLASMEAKEEFDAAEKKWNQLKSKASAIADDAVETSDEYIAKAKVIGEEIKEAYRRIARRLSD